MNRKAVKSAFSGSILLLVLFLAGPLVAQDSAQDDDAIGRILIVKGGVTALSADGESRPLRRRSEVFAEDTILTGAAGFAQIRLVDSAIVALKENTEFKFNEYSFDGEGGESDRAIMELVRGGFRTIDGLIGEEQGDEYRVDTQYASIGVRGTTHEAVIDQALDALFTGVYEGGTTVTSPAAPNSPLDLGVGGGYDFSRTDRGQAPVGLLNIPEQLGQINIEPVNDQDDQGDDGDTNEDEGDTDSDDTDGNDGDSDTDGNDGETDGAGDDGDNQDGNDGAGDNSDAEDTTPPPPATDNTAEAGATADDDNDDQTIVALNELSDDASANTSLGSNSQGNSANAPGTTVAAAATSGNPSNTESESTETDGNSSTNVDVQINPANNARSASALAGDESDDSDSSPGNSGNSNGNGNNSDDDADADDSDSSPGNSGNSNGNGNNSDDDADADDSDSSPGNSGNSNGNGNNSDDDADADDSDSSPGNSGNSNGNGNNSDDDADADDSDSSPGNSGNSNGNGNNSDDDADADDSDSSPGNSGNSNGNGNNSDDDADADDSDSSPGNSGNSNGNGNNSDDDADADDSDSSPGNSGNSNGNGNNSDDDADADDSDSSPGNSGNNGNGSNSGDDTGADDSDSGPGNSGNNNGNGSNSGDDAAGDDPDADKPGNKKGDCLVLRKCDTDDAGNDDDSSKGNGNDKDDKGNNGKNSSGLAQATNSYIQGLFNSVKSVVTASGKLVSTASAEGGTVLFSKVPAANEGSLESAASVGDLTVDWGYWSLPGLLDSDQEFTGQDFQRVYLAVVDPADMDELKSTSGSWTYNSVANQFTGSGSGGTMTDLNVGFDVDLNSGAISNGSFNAEVGYGDETWSMNFTGSINGANASMDNFSNAVVITPAGMTQGIGGELGGTFTGTGNTNGFVTGFSLNNGSGAVLGGLGLLEGTPK